MLLYYKVVSLTNCRSRKGRTSKNCLGCLRNALIFLELTIAFVKGCSRPIDDDQNAVGLRLVDRTTVPVFGRVANPRTEIRYQQGRERKCMRNISRSKSQIDQENLVVSTGK